MTTNNVYRDPFGVKARTKELFEQWLREARDELTEAERALIDKAGPGRVSEIREEFESTFLQNLDLHKFGTRAATLQHDKELAQLYQEALQPSDNGKATVNVYELAKEQINSRGQWSNDLVLYDNGAGRVWVENYQAQLILNWRKNGRWERVQCGYYSPRSGWTFTLTQADYKRWVAKVKGEHLVKPSVNVLARDFGGAKSLRPSWCN